MRRWTERLEALLAGRGQPPVARENINHANAAQHVKWELENCKAKFQLVIACSTEAKAIGAAPAKGESTLKSRITQCQKLPEMSVCDTMEICRESTEQWLRFCRDMKMGRASLVDVIRWKDLPLGLRREVNQLLEEWEVAKTNGEWESDDELRELLVAGKSGEDGFACFPGHGQH